MWQNPRGTVARAPLVVTQHGSNSAPVAAPTVGMRLRTKWPANVFYDGGDGSGDAIKQTVAPPPAAPPRAAPGEPLAAAAPPSPASTAQPSSPAKACARATPAAPGPAPDWSPLRQRSAERVAAGSGLRATPHAAPLRSCLRKVALPWGGVNAIAHGERKTSGVRFVKGSAQRHLVASVDKPSARPLSPPPAQPLPPSPALPLPLLPPPVRRTPPPPPGTVVPPVPPLFSNLANAAADSTARGSATDSRGASGVGAAGDGDNSLPPGWKAKWSQRKGRYYYQHKASGTSSWDSPWGFARRRALIGTASAAARAAACLRPSVR